jgi:Gram-negative bacterial TonB protein C-terminal/PilZ domain
MSTSAEHIASMAVPPERRFYRRTVPSGWISIAFGENNVGMLLNVGENGLLVSTPVALGRNFVYRVSIKLNGLPKPIEVPVRVVWTTESKRSGIQILDISEHEREQIRKWEALEDARDAIATKSLAPEPVNEVASGFAPQNPRSALTTSEQRLVAPPPAPPANVSPQAPQEEPIATTLAPELRATTSGQPVAKTVALIATVCLALALFSKNGPLHNLIAHPGSIEEQRSAANAPSAASPESPLADRTQVPVERESTPDTNRAASDIPADTNADRGDELESVPLSRPTQNKLVTPDRDTAFLRRRPTVYKPVSPTAPIARESVPNPPPAVDLPSTPPTASSLLFVVPKPPAPVTPPLASPRVLTPSRPAATSDVSQNQTLQVTIPNIHTSIVSLPGEQVLQTSSATLHIHRSILVPVESRFWPLSRSRRVVLGGLLFRSDPQAPRGSMSSASVGVRATIDKNGHVESLQPISGSMALVPGVVRAVREWRYQPTLLDGKPVETEAFILVEFRPSTALGRGSR